MNDILNKINDLVVEFEKSHGSEALIKLSLGIICKILVGKEITTPEYLQEKMLEAIKNYQ